MAAERERFRRDSMKLRGIVRGATIELERRVQLPEGTRVELELTADGDSMDMVRVLRALHAKQRARWGKPIDLAVQFIREHRDK